MENFSTYHNMIYEKDYFAIDFSSNFTLTFREQGRELQNIINNICSVTGKKKVYLVAHSMGGLASRAYLQFSYANKNVAGLITIGTPHYGVSSLSLKILTLFRDLGVDYGAVGHLIEGSHDLNELNHLLEYPLPNDVDYFSIVCRGQNMTIQLMDFRPGLEFSDEEGDGIVSTKSQKGHFNSTELLIPYYHLENNGLPLLRWLDLPHVHETGNKDVINTVWDILINFSKGN